MTNAGPSKQDIEQIFNRLRSQTTNKICFDCSAKNPTWASVTYGVFICIDCSAVHRSLGVHLTFVRSTNLDTNWTWVQLRQMQLGGNANASQFFRQHNCNTSDAQQKYNSRAAQLYRDKLQTAAYHAIKVHGTKLLLDSQTDKAANEMKRELEEEDFFAECSNDNLEFSSSNNNLVDTTSTELFGVTPQKEESLPITVLSNEQPSVDLLNSVVPLEAPKSTIGIRKIQPKKSGLGGKKGGLGATKVKANFADIEHRANLADQQKESVPERKLTAEEELATVTSVRLAYQDLSIQKNKQEEKLKAIDPAKAKQLERLGMGFNLKGDVSHSAITDMQTIAQSSAPKHSAKTFEKEPNNDFFDEYSTPMYTSPKHDTDLLQMGWETIEPIDMQSNITTMFSSSSSSQASANKSSIDEQPGRKTLKSGRQIKTYDNDVAQKKFGSAKGISSDQYFGNEQSPIERSANLSRFQGSNSISSSDYFGDGSTNSSSHRSFNNVNFNAPDLDDVKESVRQGVTKVAGKLSTIASDVMSSLHDKYGY